MVEQHTPIALPEAGGVVYSEEGKTVTSLEEKRRTEKEKAGV